MTEEEQRELKEDNARLLREKADAVAKWHEEVRLTLKKHTDELQAILFNTAELPQLRAEMRQLEARIKIIEDFKMKAVAGISAVLAATAALWKLIDKLWQ